jgi:DNA polymerase-3 subunit delta'
LSFRNIRGQDSAISFLKGEILNGKVAHSYIFLGLGGVGKRLTAINFAKALNCPEAKDGEGCDACASCTKIGSFAHPDVSLFEPEKEGGSIGIERIRSLINDINLKSYEGKRKVYIIDEADDMTQEASNALLKTLEEPPPESVIILIARNLNLIFRTIVSRSQIVRFFPLTVDAIEKILATEHSLRPAEAHILAHLSSGSLGSALKFKEGDFSGMRESVIEAVSKGSFTGSCLEDASRDELKSYLDIMLTWYRDILAAKNGAGAEMLINLDKKDLITRLAKQLDEDEIADIIREIIMTGTFLDQNANAKLVMSVLEERICTR